MASGLCAALTGRTHGRADQPANVKKTLANSEPSTHGTKQTYRHDLLLVRFRGEADIHRGAASTLSVVNDPKRTFSASLKQRLREVACMVRGLNGGQSCTDAPSASVLAFASLGDPRVACAPGLGWNCSIRTPSRAVCDSRHLLALANQVACQPNELIE